MAARLLVVAAIVAVGGTIGLEIAGVVGLIIGAFLSWWLFGLLLWLVFIGLK